MKILLFYLGGVVFVSIFTVGVAALYMYAVSPKFRKSVANIINNWSL